jgi:prefoldin subunit 5
METKENEKVLRLQTVLEEALKPITAQLETLEKDVESVQKAQEELKKMVQKER